MRRNGFRRWLLAAFAAAAVLAGGVALAQEQVGSIEGTVTDKEGGVLPGVTVEAVSSGGSALVAVTDVNGMYRFPRLPSSVYKLTAKLDGFVTAEFPDVDLKLGKALRVNFTLQAGTFQDTITVAADTVAIDVSQSSTATSISREEIGLVPHGRDFTAVVAQASGAADEAFAGGISIDGSSGSENRFVIDGIDTTDPQTGVSAQSLAVEFVEEVQVKSAGYQAEYGGSTGGVVNAITKTGGNDFSGHIGFYFRDDSMIGEDRPIVQRDDNGNYTATVYAKDDETRWEPSLSIGGPILRDKAWFFVAYQPSMRDITRTVESQGVSRDRTEDEQYLAANLKGNVSSRFMYKLAANLSPSKTTGVLPNKNGTTPVDAPLDGKSDFTANSYSGYGDLILSDKFLVSGRLGFFETNQEDSNYPNQPDVFMSPNGTPAGTPSDLVQPAGFRSNPNNNAVIFDKYQRKAASLDASYFFEGAGTHNVKVGAQWEKLSNTVLNGEVQNLYRFRWGLSDRFGADVEGTYGSLEVRRFQTTGDVSSDNLGFFIQDGWAITKNFTLNIGVRTEKEQVPNYDPSYGKWAIDFGYGDKLAPRVGFAWDVSGDQRWKVYGSYGTYYDITKMELPRGSFGGDKWISYLYPLETVDWEMISTTCSLSNNIATENPCPFLGDPVALNLREPSTGANGGIDPDLKPMEQREYQLGVERQLSSSIVVGARYVDKHLVRTIEDMGFFEVLPDGTTSEVYTIGNPGEGVATATPPPGVPYMPKAKRDYKALELTFSRRFVDNWLLNASYTYSTLKGNYSGLASSDEFGRVSPNVNRFFDSLSSSFDEGGEPVFGYLNTDRPHQLKAQAIYQFPFRLSVGVNQYLGSGTPISTRMSYGGVWFYPFDRNDEGRTPNLSQTDLMLTQTFKFGTLGLEASLNVINLWDQKIVTNVGVDKYDNDLILGCDKSQECFFSKTPFNADTFAQSEGNVVAAEYLQPIAWQAPRSIRFGLKLTF
jgi:hypothetical protein